MSRKDELPLYKKFLICLLVVMTVFMSASIGLLGVTPVYASSPNSLVVVPQLQQNSAIVKILSAEEERLTSEGFTVISVEPDIQKMIEKTQQMRIVSQTEINGCVKATVAAILININTENYYFRSEADALSLVEKLKENGVEYIQEQVEINPKQITSSEAIETKMNELEIQHQKQVEEQKRKKQVSSRSGNFRRNTEVSAFPLEEFRYISSCYGMRHGKMHTGIDLAADAGTHVLAWKSGTVITSKWNGNYGNFIEVQHTDGTISRYAHLSRYVVAAGDTVNQGQLIGYVGSTGNSTRSSFTLGGQG